MEDSVLVKPGERVVVTGGTGFIGCHLVRRLLELGARVRTLVRPGSDTGRIPREEVELFAGDLRDGSSLEGLCEGVDRLFHLAAVQRYDKDDSQVFDVNVEGTQRLLSRAFRDGVHRVVLVSSGGVHDSASGNPVTEDSPLRPTNIYFRSKVEAEAVAREIFRLQPGRLTIVRPGAVYGADDGRLEVLYRAVARGRFIMIGPGTRRIHPVHVDDLVCGLLRAASDCGAGEAFLISGPSFLPLRNWIEAIALAAGVRAPRWSLPMGPVYAGATFLEFACRPFGVVPPISRRRLGFFVHHRCYDLSKARSVLGYEPRISVQEGLRRTIDWYRARRLL